MSIKFTKKCNENRHFCAFCENYTKVLHLFCVCKKYPSPKQKRADNRGYLLFECYYLPEKREVYSFSSFFFLCAAK